MNLFEIYILAYTFVAILYLWYRYIFIFGYNDKTYGNYSGKVSVVVPYYNEKPELLIRTIKSINACYGDKEIIVVDDGSTSKDCYNAMKKLQSQIKFQLIRYEKNMGKRYAQCLAFEKAKGEILMTVDSDTILEKKAILELIKPFYDKKVGATTGQLEALNRNTNFLTKMQAARYWNAFNFERQSQGTFGCIVCCSGPISAYRKEIVLGFINKYKNQHFLGKACTFGDDRHLTTLILKNGYEIKFVKSARGYTAVPETWKGLIKQQIRWKKSWIRETYLVSKFMKKNKPLSFEVAFTTFITFFSLAARIMLIVSLLMVPLYFLYVIPMILFMGTIHSLYVLFNKPEHFPYSIAYSFVQVFLIYWLLFIALFTFKDTRWGTR